MERLWREHEADDQLEFWPKEPRKNRFKKILLGLAVLLALFIISLPAWA